MGSALSEKNFLEDSLLLWFSMECVSDCIDTNIACVTYYRRSAE